MLIHCCCSLLFCRILNMEIRINASLVGFVRAAVMLLTACFTCWDPWDALTNPVRKAVLRGSYLGSLARSSPCSTWLCGWAWSSSCGTRPFAARRSHTCIGRSLPGHHVWQCGEGENTGRWVLHGGLGCFSFLIAISAIHWIKMWCGRLQSSHSAC